MRDRFLETVLGNPVIETILERAPQLGLGEWYLTAGGLVQTVWNHLDGRELGAGIKDYDLFYFDDSDLTYDAEDRVIRSAAELFADADVEIEVRNEARVHLWYEEHFGSPGVPFTSCRDAIDHFASTTCCFGITRTVGGDLDVYAPHGYDDLFAMIVRPNPVLAPREVYETKAARWQQEWPSLVVELWPRES
ncbi:hypothetical protein ABH922_003807 [Rhodococcus sp. 27YEA15]|uniref:nucleotidyltransferase family protein n=1 Tax=Rhodococcus sp. 27YEA15 TaxID=3156259 RepID=UPI003C7D76ED